MQRAMETGHCSPDSAYSIYSKYEAIVCSTSSTCVFRTMSIPYRIPPFLLTRVQVCARVFTHLITTPPSPRTPPRTPCSVFAMADVGRLAKELAASKISTERVEVDDDSAPPTVAANSSEEKALLKELDGLLPEALKAVPDATKLMCLRGRKYDPARGAETLQALEDLKETLELSHPPPQLAADIASGKVTNPGGVDEMGRSVIWMRLRFNNPKESGPQDMGRLIAKVMLNALENVETQRNGVVLINDMSGIGVKNLSPSTVKYIMGEVYCPRCSSRTRT